MKSKGFEKQKSTDPHFVEFRRVTPEGVDVFEVKWDKYWRPYFVINFAKEKTDDPKWEKGGRLQRKRGGLLSCWFSLSRPLINKLLSLRWSYQPYEVVQELQQAFIELEKWWERGEIGSHIYFSSLHA
ncbi:hypothetical protein [Shewanella mangrovisoli]|uniref:Uncharacterized protein n=1 Tax=Shewanella mangrovisoli TaxID=2864211 RepID=A0ABV4VHE6_9GAMM